MRWGYFEKGQWIEMGMALTEDTKTLEERVRDLEYIIEETHHLILDIYGKLTIPDPEVEKMVRKLMLLCRTEATGKDTL